MKAFLLLILLTHVALASPRYDENIDSDELPLKIERHKRMYFIAGEENTKLQVSFKIPVLVDSNLYFAYTETGFWELFQKTSNPFMDINHNPELFYRMKLAEDHSVDFGIEHVSNGRAEVNSRSWNSLYAQTMSRNGKYFYYTTKLYYLWDVDATNDNVFDYMGLIDMEIGVREIIRSKYQSNQLFVRWRPGGTIGEFNTIEAGLKVKFSDWKYFQHFFLSYYNGYVESQLNYNKYVRALRLGFTF